MANNLLDETTFNAGSSSQLLDQSYYLLREICKTNQVKTVYLDTIFIALQAVSSRNDNYVDFMYRLCEEYNISYMNFNLYKGETGITVEDFKDAHHLNGQGAEKYTELFCNVVNEINNAGVAVEDLFERYYSQ